METQREGVICGTTRGLSKGSNFRQGMTARTGGTAMLGIQARLRVLAFAVSLVVTLLSSTSMAATVLIGSSASASWLPIWLADARGYFREEGVDVRILLFSSAPDAARALVAGDIQLAGLAIERSIQASLQGRPIVSVMAIQNTPPSAVVMRKDAGYAPGNFAQFAGKTVGIVPGGWSEILVRFMLARQGVDARQVRLLSTPNPVTQLAALENGQIDFLSAIEPAQSTAIVQGRAAMFFDLEDPMTLQQYWPLPFVATTLQATRSWAESHPDEVRAVVRAIRRSLAYIRAEPSEAARFWAERSSDASLDVWQTAVRRLLVTWSEDGVLTPEAVRNVQELLVEYGIVPRALPFEELVLTVGQ